jgi:hypothetical protein
MSRLLPTQVSHLGYIITITASTNNAKYAAVFLIAAGVYATCLPSPYPELLLKSLIQVSVCSLYFIDHAKQYWRALQKGDDYGFTAGCR